MKKLFAILAAFILFGCISQPCTVTNYNTYQNYSNCSQWNITVNNSKLDYSWENSTVQFTWYSSGNCTCPEVR